jgi:hypothetical protein
MPKDTPAVTNTEIATFCQQFSSLTHAQLNILDIFEALREQTSNPLLREIVESLRTDVENGRTLATAFSRYPSVFSPFFISMVRQGELEGELDKAMGDLAEHYASRLDATPDAKRTDAPLYDWDSAARSFQWLFIWATALVAFCLLGAGLIWYATWLRAVPGEVLPNIFIFVAIIMFLGVLVFSLGRKKR